MKVLEEIDEGEVENRKSLYSPIKERESFIERKIRLLNENDGKRQENFGRSSLDGLEMKPKISRV